MSVHSIREERRPLALESSLGWVLSGPVGDCPSPDSTQVNFADTHVLKLASDVMNEERGIAKQVSKFMDLESIGILNEETSLYETFQDEIHFKDGKYEVWLPWKQEHPLLPDNHAIYSRRLQSTMARLKADPMLIEEYDQVIKDQEKSVIIVRIDPNQEANVGNVTKHIERYAKAHPELSNELIHGLYADDVNSEEYNVNEAIEFQKCSTRMMKEGGFNFRKGASNSTEHMNEIYPYEVKSDNSKQSCSEWR
eukprot:gene6522-11986_t